MKLIEKFKEKGLFKIMYDTYPERYQLLFDGMDAETLDDMLIIKCGEREIAQPYLLPEKIVKVLLALFGDTWKRYKSALNLNYSLDETYRMTVTSNSNKSLENTANGNDRKTDKIFGFDSTTPSDSAIQESTSQNTSNATETGNGTTTTSGSNVPFQDVVKKELVLRKANNYINIVLDDIKGYITLMVY